MPKGAVKDIKVPKGRPKGKADKVRGKQPGRKYDPAEKEHALALMITEGNLQKVSRDINIPVTTLHQWKKQNGLTEMAENAAELRKLKQQEFVDNAWIAINDGLTLVKRRIKRALESEAELDKILEAIKGDASLTGPAKESAISKVRALELQQLKDVTTAIGTLYDKQQLAAGGATQNIALAMSDSDRSLLNKVGQLIEITNPSTLPEAETGENE